MAAFTVGNFLYCKFNGNEITSQDVQAKVAQLPDEYKYKINKSIGVYRTSLIHEKPNRIGICQIDVEGNINLYCPYTYLYGIVIIPIK